jgi:hypothetical protein
MKRVIATLATTVALGVGGGTVVAWASGAPEIDSTAANVTLNPTTLQSRACPGEDGARYVTYTGTWKGSEADLGWPTDYTPMTGPLTLNNVVWTVKVSGSDPRLAPGLLNATAVLVRGDGSGTVVYSGPLTLITQGIPEDPQQVSQVLGRGLIDASTFTAGVKDGGSVAANVELNITPTLAATGKFGQASYGFPDFSVATNNHTC